MTRSRYWITMEVHTCFDIDGESPEANKLDLTMQVKMLENKMPGATNWRIVQEEHEG